jgi:hypothetical protein
MNQVFAVSSFQSVGCTFLDWSIHYISGQQQFYNIKQQQWIALSGNPLNAINAHGHFKNHPRGFCESQQQLQQLIKIDGVASFYPYCMSMVDAAQQLGISIDQGVLDSEFSKILNSQKHEYNQILNLIADSPAKLIYVDLAADAILYSINRRSTESTVLKNPEKNKHYTLQQQQQDYQQLFFKDSVDVWEKLNLINRWDQREQMALCTRPFDTATTTGITVDLPHLRLDSRLWWTAGEAVITQVLDYLKLPIMPERLHTWRPIYQQWQRPQLQSLEFVFNHQHIVDCIVNNHWCEIDLSFEQEVVIQHCLIYQHGLNLKTWGLEKFPNNTKLLHQLLEPNFHPITR